MSRRDHAAAEQWAARNGWSLSRNASLPFELGGPEDGRGQAEILLSFAPETVDLTLGHPPFDEEFEIVATDPEVARSLVGPMLAEEHAAGRAPTWTIQGDDLSTLQRASPIVPDEIPALLSALLRVADLLGR